MKTSSLRSNLIRLAGLASAALCILSFTPRASDAQPANGAADALQMRTWYSVAAKALREGAFAGNQQADFDKYYTTLVQEHWTKATARAYLAEDDRSEVPIYEKVGRKRLRNELMNAGKSGDTPVHQRLNAILLEEMGKLAAGKYDAAVRVNAMLMIGELNSEEPKVGSPAQPLAAAIPVLVATVKEPRQIEAVKVAALVGLERHCVVGGLGPQAQQAIIEVLAPLAATPAANGKLTDGHIWLRAKAAHILGLLKSAGPAGSVAKALGRMTADKSLPLTARCMAAGALGQLDLAGGGVPPESYAQVLIRLAMEVLKADVASSSRSRLKDRLQQLTAGLAAVETLGSAEAKTARDALDAIVKKLETSEVSADILKETQRTLEGLVPKSK